MLIFRFEWKRKRKYILIWAATLAVCIFSMTPVYYGMIETVETLPVEFTQGGFFETVGISLELLMEPLGMYSFLTGFFMVAGGISGCTWGCRYIQKSVREIRLNTYTQSLVDGNRFIWESCYVRLPEYV